MYALLDSLTPEQQKQAVKRNPHMRALMECLGAKPRNTATRRGSKPDLRTAQARLRMLQLKNDAGRR